MADTLQTEVLVVPNGVGPPSPSTSQQASPSQSPRQSPKQSPKLQAHRELPPGWQRVRSEKGTYYWETSTNKTTWKFPQVAAEEHRVRQRTHTYENVKKAPPPSPGTATPPQRSSPQARHKLSATGHSTRHSYENVQWTQSAAVPSTGLPLPDRRSSEGELLPLSPTPPLPERRYEDLSPPPPLPSRRYTADPTALKGKSSASEAAASLSQDSITESTAAAAAAAPLQHEESDGGNLYTVVDRNRKTSAPETTIRPIVSSETHQYAVLDLPQSTRQPATKTTKDPAYQDSIAYAIVRLEGTSQSPSPSSEAGETLRAPSPYEVPSPSSSLKRSTPHYEEMDFSDSEPPENGYMVVQHDSHKLRPSSQQPQRHHSKPPSSLEKAHRMSFDKSPSPPLPDEEEHSQDSVGAPERDLFSPFVDPLEEVAKYDVPLNSRKLQALNVTLRRTDNHGGYSKLGASEGLSKDAILLRSGVTLRRFQRASLSSMSSFVSKSEAEEESGGSSSNDEDGLEAVNKCIKSLETSLEREEAYIKMARAPVGPPHWKNFQRRPHTYEDMPQSQELAEAGSLGDIADLVWDETDLSEGAERRQLNVGGAESASQPILPSGDHVSSSFPHMVKPDRVSEEAFGLRKMRLMKHNYEDVEDKPEWSVEGASPESVSDVNALSSAAVQESWVEGEGGAGGKLPRGWQRLTDERGRLYFWHVPSGKTQYSRPSLEETQTLLASVTLEEPPSQLLETSPASGGVDRGRTFSAHYLGSAGVPEEELVPGHCVRVVHACINQLTASQDSGKHNGKPVFLQIQGRELRWLEPTTSQASFSQPINRIRVWGIGLENERNFGYVARDLATSKHRCHVFRCDMPARAVARALLDSHQHSRRHKEPLYDDPNSLLDEDRAARSISPEANNAVKESLLGAGMERSKTSSSSQPAGQQEHYQRISCTYIGSCDVTKALGMEVLNEAVDKLKATPHRWFDVHVDVATSHTKITDARTNQQLKEHRVRFLCFLGIANDDRFCGYILDSGEKAGEKTFKFYGFRREPNTDKLCLALHSACQARYQRVLDANPDAVTEGGQTSPEKPRQRASTSGLLGKLGSRLARKAASPEGDGAGKAQSFVVQYLGSQQVARPDGVDTVKEPLQQLAVPKHSVSSAPPHLVMFDVASAGLTLTDPQKKLFTRKTFAVRNITYVVKIRNYFAFIARESGKFHCHVFLESEVDSATIVKSIQVALAPDSCRGQRR